MEQEEINYLYLFNLVLYCTNYFRGFILVVFGFCFLICFLFLFLLLFLFLRLSWFRLSTFVRVFSPSSDLTGRWSAGWRPTVSKSFLRSTSWSSSWRTRRRIFSYFSIFTAAWSRLKFFSISWLRSPSSISISVGFIVGFWSWSWSCHCLMIDFWRTNYFCFF